MTPIVYIHGHFNGCNLALAEELSKLMPKTEIIDDNLNAEPARAATQTPEEYRSLRIAMRRKKLQAIYNSEAASETTWVMIDEYDTNENRGYLAADYEFAAVMSHSPLISIILKFDADIAYKRAKERFRDGEVSEERVQDLKELCRKCREEEVFRFRNSYELVLDVTMMSPTMAAEACESRPAVAGIIQDWIRKVQEAISVRKEDSYCGIQ
ncbi:hypothetical protein MKX08_000210 [Trichoderma sp. CBMAI-0020]|nr:hypothetical protein MKX08_000210 [Trichoderma sp. CBMAI-0020]